MEAAARRQRRSYSFSQPAGFFGLVLAGQQFAMCCLNPILICLWLRLLRWICLRQPCEDNKREQNTNVIIRAKFPRFISVLHFWT